MLFFQNDYNTLCHPEVLATITALESERMVGYGMDTICRKAAELIAERCAPTKTQVHFLVGGTQANLTVIAAALRPHHAVVGAETAHINVHETGAIEATGHKVIGLDSPDGKVQAQQVRKLLELHVSDADAEHTAKPQMVYISNPTELGTLYTRQELKDLHDVCRQFGLYLYLDGARLGYALGAKGNDVTLPDLAELCDVFYIGGTKVGAMFGEAVVISNPAIAEDFRYLIKQRGGMLAKGWLLGAQFYALFRENLYDHIGVQANRYADKIREVLDRMGYPLLIPGVTNQIFPILPDTVIEKLSALVRFSYQKRIDETHSAVRFCTSWATTEQEVAELCELLQTTAS